MSASARKEVDVAAYDYCIKTSHMFNLLDARGAISVTERTSYIARVRALARRCAESYVADREAMGHPLIKQPARTGRSHQPLTGHHQVACGPNPTMPTKNPRPRLFHARRKLHLSPAPRRRHDGIVA